MEGSIQKVFAVLISILILFILPLYIAFEKKDDISYSLALKITNNFVDNVVNKGYLSKDMYSKYVQDLESTGNIYDISLEHRSKKYYPVLCIYKDNTKKEIVTTVDYNVYRNKYEDLIKKNEAGTNSAFDIKSDKGDNINIKNTDLDRIIVTYNLQEELYNQSQILEVLGRGDKIKATDRRIYKRISIDEYKSITKDSISSIPTMYGFMDYDTNNVPTNVSNNYVYAMSKGDEFTVRVKNTNVTTAAVLFNAFTVGMSKANDTRVYINYGGTIKNDEYKDIDLNGSTAQL